MTDLDYLSAPFPAPLPDLLSAVLGSMAASASYELLNQQPDYWVIGVQGKQTADQFIVKLAGRESTMAAAFERTALIHNLVRSHTNVPLAEIIAVDVSYIHFPWRYLIQKRVQGQVWALVAPHLDPAQKRSAYQQMGNAIAQLHGIEFAQFGEINALRPKPNEGTASFTDALLDRAKRMIHQEYLYKRFAEVVSTHGELFNLARPPALCHDDLHHYNILFGHEGKQWSLAAILDFDKAWAGHAESDMARLDFWDDMMGDGFRDSYCARHVPDAGYEARRPIYQLLWCLEFAERTPRHLADMQRLCEQLEIAPITL